MKMKKYLACLMAALMMAGTMVACGDNAEGGNGGANAPAGDAGSSVSVTDDSVDDEIGDTESDIDSSADEESAVETIPAAEFEDAVQVTDGQAFLAYTNGEEWIRYDGDPVGNPEQNQLAYDAGVVDITGNGTYTVSLNADTNGFRYDATTDTESDFLPSGVAFAAVVIKGGEALMPDAIITIDKITVDGTEVEMNAKNYTSIEDGNIRSNIYNKYVEAPSSDAKSTEGALYDEEGNPVLDNVDEYSPNIIDASAIGEWKKIEVTFTVSGLSAQAASIDANDADAETPDSAADDEDSSTAEDAPAVEDSDADVIDGDGEAKADFIIE